MTCGIYRLVFDGTDKCYIGQSVNIEYRYTQHLRSLENGTASKKMLLAYSAYGKPSLDILLDNIDPSDLNTLEDEAIEIFDSFENGFNQLEHAEDIFIGKGIDNGNSRYTKQQILSVFNLLVHTELQYPEISYQTGVSKGTITKISNCTQHTWLEKESPSMYAVLKYKITNGIRLTTGYEKIQSGNLGIVYPEILQPDNKVYNITNLKAFAREHSLDQRALTRVLHRYAKQHKGWRLNE